VAGLFLGWLAERFDGVRPSIAAHAINNALFVALASVGSGEVGSRRAQWIVLAAGAVVFSASTMLLRSRAAVRS